MYTMPSAFVKMSSVLLFALLVLPVAGAVEAQTFVQLTDHPGVDRHPSWTPDGAAIIFESNRFGTFDLFRVPSSGGIPERLTDGPGDESFPEVSPDGTRIAFSSLQWAYFGPYGNIHVMPIEGGPWTRLSTSTHPRDHDWHPAWSRDGATIYFSRRNGADFADWDIMQVPSAGGATTFFVDANGVQNRPIPSWDGTRIAYETNALNGFINIAETTFENPSQIRQLTFESASTGAMGYSPDGKKMVYSSRKLQGWFDLYLLDLADLTSTRLTFDIDTHSFDPNNADAVFSPNGRKIAFTSRRLDGNDNIWVLDLGLPPARVVSIDSDPQQCPNEISTHAQGIMWVAVHSEEDLTPEGIDFATVRLQGSVVPDRWRLWDAGSPNGLDACTCPPGEKDGIEDLLLAFAERDLFAVLPDVSDGTRIVLELTGSLVDGTPFSGSDCVLVVEHGRVPPTSPRDTRILSVAPPGRKEIAVTYSISTPGMVFLRIVDVAGREVRNVLGDFRDAGEFTSRVESSGFSPGVYFFLLESETARDAKKFIVIR